jgi:hypothetical protein
MGQKLVLSPENLNDNGLDYLKVIGQDDEGFFVLHSNLSLESQRDRIGLRTRKYKLSYFDNNLRPLWQKNLGAHPENATIESVSFFNGKILVIESDWSRSENTFTIFMDVYDTKGTLIIAGRKTGTCNVERSASLSKPKLIISTGKNFAGVYLEEIRDQEQIIHCIICDTSFQSITQKRFSIPYSEKDFNISDYGLTEQQQLVLLAQLREKDPASEKKKLRSFKLFVSIKNETSLKSFKVNDGEHQMSEAALAIDKANNKVIVTGFYADKSSFAGAGILYASLPLENPAEIDIHTYPLNSSTQVKLIGERNAGSNISLFNYPIQKVILRSDGGAVLVAEAAYLSEYSYYDYFTQSFNRRIEYHYDNIVVLSLSATGVVDWSQVIRKDQTSLDDEGIYASFSSILNSDQVVIIYNNDIGRNNEVVGLSINNKGQAGNIKFSKIGDSISILPRAGRQIDEGIMVVPVINKKKLYLAKISL